MKSLWKGIAIAGMWASVATVAFVSPLAAVIVAVCALLGTMVVALFDS